MKHNQYMIVAGMITLVLASCKLDSKEEGGQDKGIQVIEQNADDMIYGTLLNKRGDDSVQILTDMGDSLWMTIQDPESVKGDLMVDDRMAVLPSHGNRHVISTLINLTQMMGDWVEPSPLDEGAGQGVQLLEGGTAVSINSQTTDYESWNLWRGKLILNSRPAGFEDTEEMTDTFEITRLTADSLQLRNDATRFLFTHQLNTEKPNTDGLDMDDMIGQHDDYDLFNPEGDVAPKGEEKEDGLMLDDQ